MTKLKVKKQIFFLLFFVAVMTAWCLPNVAATQNQAGSGNLNDTGVKEGVAMTGGGTLTVGTQDIYTDNRSSDGVVNNSLSPAVTSDADNTHSIAFNGSSNVYGYVGGTKVFLGITAGVAGTTVKFLGRVNAGILDVNGTGTVDFNSGASNSTAVHLHGDGTVSLAANTTVIGALTNPAGANKGTLELGSGSKWDGAAGDNGGLKAINVAGGSNSAGVTATITGAVTAYTFSLGTNTLYIDGALTMPNLTTGGVIYTTLASPTVYGNIRPKGSTNIGSTLGLSVTVPSTADIKVGTQFDIIKTQAGTAQSGTDSSIATVTVVNPTNPLYTFSQVPISGTVAGLVTIEVTGIPLQASITPPAGVVLPPAAPIAAVVAQALIDAPDTADIIIVRATINALSDANDVVNAEAQLAPLSPALAAGLVTFQGTREFQNLWLSRLDMCSQFSRRYPDEEDPGCRADKPRSGWWLKSFGYLGTQRDDGAFAGYDSKIFGTMIAYDAPLGSNNTRAGLGFGYAQSDIDGKTFDTNTDFDTYQTMAYIGHESGPWFVNGAMSFGWNEYSGKRHILYTGMDRTANADYNGQDYVAFTSTGYHFLAQKVTITPLASLQYTHVNLDSYTETGAGDISLRVNSQGYDFYESGLGVKAEREFSYRSGTYVPDVHAKWLHDFSNPKLEQTTAFTAEGASSFTTPGLKTSDDTYNVGIGLTFLSCACGATKWSLEAGYDHDWRDDGYFANKATVRFTKRF